jgi:hypothetical protein
MARHRGLFLALGLCALIGLSAREGRAESITITVSTNGVTDTLTNAAWVNSTNVNLDALNTFLSSNGSAYQFSALGAQSNFTGKPFPDPNGGSLSSNGGVNIAPDSTGATGDLVITITEGGFLNPTGPDGSLASSTGTTYTNVATGSYSYFSDFNGMNGNTGSNASTGVVANQGDPNPIVIAPTGVGSVAANYSLSNNLTINLTQNPDSTAQFGWTSGATLTAGAIPEPASLIMMLTGMPLPLVVLGLLRRRRAAA